MLMLIPAISRRCNGQIIRFSFEKFSIGEADNELEWYKTSLHFHAQKTETCVFYMEQNRSAQHLVTHVTYPFPDYKFTCSSRLTQLTNRQWIDWLIIDDATDIDSITFCFTRGFHSKNINLSD